MENYFQHLYNIVPETVEPEARNKHLDAIASPISSEAPILGLFRAWLMYADDYRNQNGRQVGQDGNVGSEWADIGKGIDGLLNGRIGRLHRETLRGLIDQALCEALVDETEDDEETD
jgi:hypothetical protein